MELQLGLALSSSTATSSFSTNTFDLNSCSFELKNQEWFSKGGGVDDFSSKKRSFVDAFEDENEPQTLPLLQWNNQPPDDEDDREDVHKNCSLGFIKVDEDEEDGIVGWPPIKLRRKKLCYRNRNNYRRVENGCVDCYGRSSNSMYIKVKVDGVGIARKVNLSRFDSFEMLKATLLDMFEIYEDNSRSYKLIYQDRGGDWLLTGDISWRSFIMSVQRLRLIRRSFR